MRSLWHLGLAALLPMGAAAAASAPIVLADPALGLNGSWQQRDFGSATEFSQVTVEGVSAIRAVGHNSASGLYRTVDLGLADHPVLHWQWRVERLQASADLRDRDAEDFAAAIFLIFGDPGTADSRSLAYVWTNDRLAPETVVPSPRHPEQVRSIVVESGTRQLGQWLQEERDIEADFRRAFGREAPAQVQAVALFTDNDQTGEPVEAYYGPIRALMR